MYEVWRLGKAAIKWHRMVSFRTSRLVNNEVQLNKPDSPLLNQAHPWVDNSLCRISTTSGVLLRSSATPSFYNCGCEVETSWKVIMTNIVPSYILSAYSFSINLEMPRGTGNWVNLGLVLSTRTNNNSAVDKY